MIHKCEAQNKSFFDNTVMCILIHPAVFIMYCKNHSSGWEMMRAGLANRLDCLLCIKLLVLFKIDLDDRS